MQSFPTVLVVDEVASRRDALRAVLGQRWPELSWREAGGEAEIKVVFTEAFPDLVLIQEELSWISGNELVSILRTKWPRSRIILHTARTESELRQSASGGTTAGCAILSSLDPQQFFAAVCESVGALIPSSFARKPMADAVPLSAGVEMELFRELVHWVGDGVLVMQWPEERVVYANPALLHLFGCSPDELKQLRLTELHPKDQVRWIKETRRPAPQPPDLEGKELRCLRKDGAEMYADVRPVWASAAGRERLVLFYREVTERRLQERKFRELAESLPGPHNGGDFWRLLVNGGSRTFEGATFFVASPIQRNLPTLQVLASAGDARFPSQGTLPVEGEPWTELFRRRLVGQAKAVQKDFPRSNTLRVLEAEAFLGLPVHDERDQLAAVIAVISREPLTKVKTAKALLQIYGALAAQHLQSAALRVAQI